MQHRRLRRAALALFLPLALLAAAPERDVVVVNHSPRPIKEIHASPISAAGWGDNRLPGTLPPGRAFRLHLGASPDCQWDVQVTYVGGATEETRGHDLCRVREIAFDGSDAALAASHEAIIVNRASRAIDGVFISPSDADGWGEDRLSNTNIPPGGRLVVTWSGACPADLRVVFGSVGAEERHGMNLCALPLVTIAPGWTTAESPAMASTASPAAEPAAPPTTRVRDDGTAPIVALYADPPDAPRGPDRLGDAVLAVGQTFSLPPPEQGKCRYHVVAVFRDGHEAAADCDLCHDDEVALH